MKKRKINEILANLNNFDPEVESVYRMCPEEVESLKDILKLLSIMTAQFEKYR